MDDGPGGVLPEPKDEPQAASPKPTEPASDAGPEAESDEEHYTRLYTFLEKLSGQVIDRTRTFDLDIPIYKLAWLDVKGRFDPNSQTALRGMVYYLLERSNGFRRDLWEFIKAVRIHFDQEMIADGSYSPNLPRYESLKNDIHAAILAVDRKVWAARYESYIDEIRARSQKTDRPPRSGEAMFDDLSRMVEDRVAGLRDGQRRVMADFELFRSDVRRILAEPGSVMSPRFSVVYSPAPSGPVKDKEAAKRAASGGRPPRRRAKRAQSRDREFKRKLRVLAESE